MFPLLLFLSISLLSPSIESSVICYECYANSTEAGRFCSIDKLCKGSSCFFNFNSDSSWSAGCSESLSVNQNITCSAATSGSTSWGCSCNSDFCNSLAKSEAALKASAQSGRGSWFGNRRHESQNVDITLTLPDRGLVHCEECGSVTVNGETVVIPCDRNHTCRGNYCVSVRGQTPYSYCGGVWDVEKAPACYFNYTDPEMCICSMNMCNGLLEPEPLMTTTVALGDPTLATIKPIPPAPVQNDVATEAVQPVITTEKPTTKRRCKNAKLSPNDQAVFMGEKLKNVIMGGFGSDDGAVQNFEDDINDHICNYSDDEEEEEAKKK